MARSRTRRKYGLLRVALWILGVIGVGLAAGAGALSLLGMPTYEVPKPPVTVQVTPARVERGKRLVSMLCRRCHFDGSTGVLQGRVMVEVPPTVGKVSAPNITRDPEAGIGGWSGSEVAVLLRTGIHPKTGALVPPRVMPRWPKMSDQDLLAILAYLQSDDPWVAPSSEQPPPTRYSLRTKFRALTRLEPLPYPRGAIAAPDPLQAEAWGAYLVDDVLQCTACHGRVWGEIDYVDPRRTPGYLAGGAATNDLNGVVLRAANLTPHETGLGGWTADQLRRALIDGFGPDGKVMRWPMVRHAGLEPDDAEAIYVYLQSLEPVETTVEPSPPYRLVGRKADPGLHLYTVHGCQYCHGQTGRGIGDLTGAVDRFATDEELIAFLEDPAQKHPLTVMPSWKGVIAPEDYPALCAYVRRLGEQAKAQGKAKKGKG